MNTNIIIFLLSIIPLCFADTSTNSTNDCTKEGEEKKQSTYWSICHNGHYSPSACIADNGSKVLIGLTVRQRNFVYQCAQSNTDANGPLVLQPIACLRSRGNLQNAIVVEAGQRVKDPPFVYECRQLQAPNPNSVALALKAVSCANATSEIPDGGTVILGQFTYNCSRQSGSLTDMHPEVFLTAKGCLYKGKEFLLDQTVLVDGFAYRCSSSSKPMASPQFAMVGCANDGKRYEHGEKYYVTRNGPSSGRFIVQCHHHNNGAWSADPVGCVQDSNPPVDHAIGDRWVDSDEGGDIRLRYVMACRDDGKSLMQVPEQCVYQPNPNDPSVTYTFNAGCMRRFRNPYVLFKCSKSRDPMQGVSAEIVKGYLKKEEDAGIAAGLTVC